MEIGPYRINPDGSLRLVDGSWDEFANVLFIDNPVGTGYSYVDGDSYVRELGEMANQLVKFLEQFFELFPHYSLDDVGHAEPRDPYLTNRKDRFISQASHTPVNISHTSRRQSSTEIRTVLRRSGIWKVY